MRDVTVIVRRRSSVVREAEVCVSVEDDATEDEVRQQASEDADWLFHDEWSDQEWSTISDTHYTLNS